jgi:hypothetical protein
MRIIAAVIYDKSPSELPHPEAEMPEFINALNTFNTSLPPAWNPTTGKMKEWIDGKMVRKCYGPGKKCAIM